MTPPEFRNCFFPIFMPYTCRSPADVSGPLARWRSFYKLTKWQIVVAGNTNES